MYKDKIRNPSKNFNFDSNLNVFTENIDDLVTLKNFLQKNVKSLSGIISGLGLENILSQLNKNECLSALELLKSTPLEELMINSKLLIG